MQRMVLFLVLGLLSASVATVAQVRSDYEIAQSFRLEFRSIQQAIDDANTMVECVDIESRIIDLETNYAKRKSMLDKALYPDGFNGSMVKLRGQIAYAKGKITIIESQYNRITEIETRVRTLGDQVERLGVENARMLSEVKRLASSKITIDSLNAMVAKLGESLRERDELVFALVDSLFLQYDKDVTMMSDTEKKGVASKLERRNVFTNTKKAIADNIQFLETIVLTGEDIAKLSSERKTFESKWKGLGPKLASVYIAAKPQRAKELSTIDTMLSRWKTKLDKLFWKTLNGVFAKYHLPIRSFKTGAEFYENVTAYLDEEIRKARDEKDGGRYFRYVTFADSIWNPQVRPSWLPSMVEDGNLTKEQTDTLEDKIDEWEGIVSPQLTLVYIVVGLVMLVVVVYLIRRYSRTQKAGGVEQPRPPAAA